MIWNERFEPWEKKSFDARSHGDIDYGRVVHSASFRRLQGKTQILNLGDSDFYRTRLTHSLEVAQIAAGLANQLKYNLPDHPAISFVPEKSMMHAIACTHDLGHPPFGHGGEVALNYCMRENGGFEGNGHTLRILTKLEKFSKAAGSNLTREALLGVLKYPVRYNDALNPLIKPGMLEGTSGTPILDRASSRPPKCYLDCEREIVDWMLNPLISSDREQFQSISLKEGEHQSANHKSFSCSIMDLADDISFGIHDMEDMLAMRLVTREQYEEHVTAEKCAGLLDYLSTHYSREYGNDTYRVLADRLFGNGNDRKHQINRILNFVIPSVQILEMLEFVEPRLRYRAVLPDSVLKFVKAIKNFIKKVVIFGPSVQHLEFKGQMMVISVFEVMKSEPKSFLPSDVYIKIENSADPLRDICDYVAGMTDAHLLKTYERLFAPRMGSVFDKL